MGDRFGFVILNYGTMDETIECVRSIGKHVKEEHEIVIIDHRMARVKHSGSYIVISVTSRLL